MNICNVLSILTLLFFSLSISAGLTKSRDDKNRFFYQNQELSFHKEIEINGYTFYENISDYSQNAVIASSEYANFDKALEIHIQHINVIQIIESSQPVYNNSIAFLIRTRIGRLYLHTRIAVETSLVEPTLSNLATVFLSSQRLTLTSGLTSGSYDIPAALHFASANDMQQAVGGTNTTTQYVWVTMQLQESMLSDQNMTLNGLFSCRYRILEESDYEAMRLNE